MQINQPAELTVSVVVPSYNHAAFVERCLRSISLQKLKPNELLVIDDGSSDGSPQIIGQALKQCSFPARLIARDNRGLAATLNEGLAKTRGKYFAYLSSDDLWLPDFLGARVSLLESQPAAVLAYGHSFTIDEDDRIIDCTTEWAAYEAGHLRSMLLSTLAPLSPSVVYRRAALPGAPWNVTAKLEDYELYLRLSGAGEFAFDERVLSCWRVHGLNTSLDIPMMLEEKLRAQKQVAAEIGLSPAELRAAQRMARFRAAQELMRQGKKRSAMKLTMENWRAIGSLKEAARMGLGLLAPGALLRRRRARRQETITRRYGSIRL